MRGLTTSPIPFGERVFQIDFDFIDHLLRIETSDGRLRQIPLRAQSVADFYVAVVAALADLRIKVKIGEWPNEVPDPIRFGEDRTHAAYDPEYARRFWRILLQVDRLFKLFRTGFIGKCSPVPSSSRWIRRGLRGKFSCRGHGGFQYVLEALQSQPPSDLAAVLRGLIVAANGQPELAGVFSTYAADTPQIYLDIDRDKAQILGVKITDIFNALQSTLGSFYINDFNVFGRTWQVNVQADTPFRDRVDDIYRIYVRNAKGGMVPIRALAEAKLVQGNNEIGLLILNRFYHCLVV